MQFVLEWFVEPMRTLHSNDWNFYQRILILRTVVHERINWEIRLVSSDMITINRKWNVRERFDWFKRPYIASVKYSNLMFANESLVKTEDWYWTTFVNQFIHNFQKILRLLRPDQHRSGTNRRIIFHKYGLRLICHRFLWIILFVLCLHHDQITNYDWIVRERIEESFMIQTWPFANTNYESFYTRFE